MITQPFLCSRSRSRLCFPTEETLCPEVGTELETVPTSGPRPLLDVRVLVVTIVGPVPVSTTPIGSIVVEIAVPMISSGVVVVSLSSLLLSRCLPEETPGTDLNERLVAPDLHHLYFRW